MIKISWFKNSIKGRAIRNYEGKTDIYKFKNWNLWWRYLYGLTAFKENYFINRLLYKKKYICKENWYGAKVRKLFSDILGSITTKVIKAKLYIMLGKQMMELVHVKQRLPVMIKLNCIQEVQVG